MQRLKDDIQRQIAEGAESLFLEKGFRKASMRDIAVKSGVSLSNIYNYYTGKDALFSELVAPAVTAIERMLDEHHGRQSMDIREMYSADYFRLVVNEYRDLLSRNRRGLELLFFHAQGSSFENFKEKYADRATQVFKEYLVRMKARHPELNVHISDFVIRLHTVWMFALFEEILRQKIKPDEIEQIVTEYITSEIYGWSELMNL